MLRFPFASLPRRPSLSRSLILAGSVVLGGIGASLAHADDDFLPPEQAFKFSAHMDGARTVVVDYAIANGYHMYRDRFQFGAAGAKLGTPALPAGKVEFDDTFGKNVETYHQNIEIRIPVDGNGPFTLTSTGQGCADKGLCYPPQDGTAQLVAGGGSAGAAPQMSVPAGQGAAPSFALPGQPAPPTDTPATRIGAPASGAATALPAVPAGGGATPPTNTDTDTNTNADARSGTTSAATNAVNSSSTGNTGVPATAASATTGADLTDPTALLRSGSLLAIIPAFILFGLALSFTPCVLPMVPILSSIIVGEGTHTSSRRGFALSVTYSLGMAIVYTLFGIAAGLAGEGLAPALQNPWVLSAFGLLIAAMALSMFDVYQLQLPAALQTRLTDASGRQSAGKTAGVFAMGAISALIVGPCVAAPLFGALVYISKTRDAFIGGAALFSMAIGMSIPLLLVGLSAGSLLPRAGLWMESVKRFFGVLMLAMALWMVAPVMPGLLQMLLWSALLIGYGCYLIRGKGKWLALAAGVTSVLLGATQLVGAVSGARDPLAPLARLGGGVAAPEQKLAFTRITTVDQLDAALATTGGKTAILDFYADWCVSCKEMEKLTFVDPAVKARLANTVLLQVDVTANDAADRALLKRFGLFGPPGIILFGRDGREIADARVIGYQDSGKFLASLGHLQ